MIIQFTIGNFLSFKEQSTLSLAASALKEIQVPAEDIIFSVGTAGLLLMKSAVVYGANASGKSNFIKAFEFFKWYVINSSKDIQAGERVNIESFRLNSLTAGEPSYFEAIFCDEDNQYRYGFEADNSSVHSEWLYPFRAINLAKKWKADVVHIHAIGPALLVPYAKMLGMKVVFTHHGPDYDRDKWGFTAKSVLKLGERLGCRFADDVIVISEVIQDLIARKYHRRERVHLIYNGVPKPEICDYPEYFEELGIEEGKYILGMCRFVPEKNLHHLIEAFKKLEAGDCKLVLAGDTDFEDEYSLGLKKMAQEAGVVLTGFVKGHKLHSLLTNARCYCLPSSHEGLPIALLEAMSYHLPVVVSNIPANLEVGLSSDCYFHCGDVDALAARLQKVIDEDYHSVQYDMAPYDWDKIAKQVMGVYEGLLK